MKVQNSLVGCGLISLLFLAGCASDAGKNHAKESAARYWQDKAYPGKSFDVQVIEAEKIEGGQFRVRGVVDGETRVGVFSPESETFSEGYYSLASERNKKIAELEQEVKYWKEKTDSLEKENYKMKVLLKMDTSSGEKDKTLDVKVK
jgi:outer membrane murein-binding lipoprotein Lpp